MKLYIVSLVWKYVRTIIVFCFYSSHFLLESFFEKNESFFEKIESFFEKIESFLEKIESYFDKLSHLLKTESLSWKVSQFR